MDFMVSPVRSEDIKSDDFTKCGEITAVVGFGKNLYAFNCTFCAAETCLPFASFDCFVMHMEEFHLPNYNILSGSEEDDCGLDIKGEDDSFPESDYSFLSKEARAEMPLNQIKSSDNEPNGSNTASLKFSDPLGGALCAESSTETIVIFKVDPEPAPSKCEEDDNMNDTYHSHIESNSIYSYESEDSLDTERDIGGSKANDLEDLGNEPIEDKVFTDSDITLAIIGSYKQQRLLWDVNDPNAKNRKKRRAAFEKIAHDVKRRLSVTIKLDNVRERIRKIRSNFRSELKIEKQSKQRQKNAQPLWYYDKLSFLNESIKCKRRKIIGARALDNEEPALPLSDLNEAENRKLINIYKSHPCLWNIQHMGYRFQNQQQDALDDMVQTIRTKMKLDLTAEELQKKIASIRYACSQEKHRKYQCELVNEPFEPVCKYYDRVLFLEPYVGPFKCSFCEEMFNGVDQYNIHKFQHDGSMPFTCPICNRGFMGSANYKVHLRRHTRDYPFKCDVCAKRFATTTDVTVHMRQHTGEKPYFCDVCGNSFRTHSLFSIHMRRHEKRPTHKCTMCKSAFYENNKLTEHIKAHFNVRDKECKVCGKKFTCGKYLRQHMQIHAEKKKYVCNICGKEFAQYAGRSGHMKTHTTVSAEEEEENPLL